MRTVPRLAGLLLLLLAAGGCSASPGWQHDREGAWTPSGVNDHNLRQMVADPAHLHWGIGTDRPVGPGAADAVERLNPDRVRRLPDTGIVRIGGGGGGAAGNGGS